MLPLPLPTLLRWQVTKTIANWHGFELTIRAHSSDMAIAGAVAARTCSGGAWISKDESQRPACFLHHGNRVLVGHALTGFTVDCDKYHAHFELWLCT